MSETGSKDWEPRDDAVLRDQRQAFDGMRERCPVAHSELMGWSLFRHADVSAVLADTATYSNASRYLAIPNGMDPPVHTRYREALEPLFSEKRMAWLEPRCREIATGLLGLTPPGEVEIIESFVTPFALRSLCALLGWREEQWECLAGWTHGNQASALNKDRAAGKALHELLSGHVKENLERQRANPADSDNAMARLLGIEVEGEPFDDDQIVSVLRNWTAGHGTVAGSLGIVLLHLAEDAALQQRLRADPADIPAAIEEILRVDGPLVANRRSVLRDVEIQGRSIRRGESVSLMWIAANRDPRVLDNADVVDIDRDTQAGLVWGKGIHFCQGAPLARLEMRIALEEILLRTQAFSLADSAPRRAVFPGNGIEELRLRTR